MKTLYHSPGTTLYGIRDYYYYPTLAFGSATESDVTNHSLEAGRIINLRIEPFDNQFTTNITFTLRKNGSDTSTTFIVQGANDAVFNASIFNNSIFDTADPAVQDIPINYDFNIGDRLTWKSTGDGVSTYCHANIQMIIDYY